jgi:putative addiction module component (TIGR02574 family)
MVSMATADELLEAALKLPVRDRARIAHELLLSLGVPGEGAEASGDRELDSRAQDVVAGKVRLVSVEESRRRVAEAIERVRRER